MLIRARGSADWEQVAIRQDGPTVILQTTQREYRATERDDGYLEGGYGAIVALSEQVEQDGAELRGCVNCRHFRFSGMTYDCTNGWDGYCDLTKQDGRAYFVSIDYGCGEHDLIPVWASDRGAAQAERVALWNESSSASREAAFVGATVGSAVGDALGFPAGIPDSRLKQPSMQVRPGRRLFVSERLHETKCRAIACIRWSRSWRPAWSSASATARLI